jgi:hypothetical protein
MRDRKIQFALESAIDMNLVKPFSTILVVLIMASCAQTPAPPESTSPRQEQARQTPPADGEASSETSESGQQESPTESKSGRATSTEAAAGQQTEPESTTPAESESQKSEQQSRTGQVSAADSAEAKLAEARKNLRISQETEKRIADELEQLKQSGSASQEAVRDYETYLKSVEAMTAENRKIVAQMEAAYAKRSSAPTASGQPPASGRDPMADEGMTEGQPLDEVAALDRQLNSSLAKFDGMLLKEMDAIRAESSQKLQGLAEEAAEAAKRLREKGLDVETAGSKSSGEKQSDTEDQSSTEREMESGAGRTGAESTTKDASQEDGQGPTGKSGRRVDYEDDDIVARQLREAAEKETDPELKKKLWKEYEEYKKSK